MINRTTKHTNTGNVTIDEFFEHFSVLNATEGNDSGLESSSESQIPGNVCNEYSESETLKLTFSQYSSIHTNYIIHHCTTLQYNHNI